ncbi:hypothetical protein SAY87_011216 [Trapa incisa]|uniref:Uncharacterized protein n=1 Tax=Trapa incisa TaxID=236973 RepID=A0AAN7GMK9_9MYRT|nr:hypothetical protein SAY87_011216 [Trapa incisa]
MEENNGCKMDYLATWLGSTGACAFFSSLEHFACVNATTTDIDDTSDRLLPFDIPNSSISDPSEAASLHGTPRAFSTCLWLCPR